MTAHDLDPLTRIDPWVALADGRAQLLAALAQIDARDACARIEGETRIVDVIVQSTAWDVRLTACFTLQTLGIRDLDAGLDSTAGATAWDAERETQASFDALIERMHAARAAMLDAASTIADGNLDEHFVAPWGARDSVRGFLIECAMRDGAHAASIQALGKIRVNPQPEVM